MNAFVVASCSRSRNSGPILLVLIGFWGCGPQSTTRTAANIATQTAAPDDVPPAPIVPAVPSGPTPPPAKNDLSTPWDTASLPGRVVWMADALEQRWGIRTVPEAKQRLLALEGADGRLYPIVEDARGRAFRVDPKLRDRDVELLVRKYRAADMIQIIRVYTIKSGRKFQLDYWCDVCSISMIEDGPCDCCQQPNRLRERPAEQ